MAQSFGRRGSCSPAALVAPEGPGLSVSGGRTWDLDKASLRVIRALQGGAIDFTDRPFNNRKPTTRDGIGLNSGALLVREWRGKLERVMVLDKGFAWNGKTFGSLSQLAKAITGVSWNGHRFFGLRSAKDQSSKRGVARPSAGGHERARLTRRRVNASEQDSHVLVDGEPLRDSVKMCP
jgi:Protein of unknown function (DUF2924)